MAMDPVHDIGPGREVYTADGERLGRVKAVTDAAIKIDAALRPDYWLPRARVLSFTNERVTVDFNRADLDAHQVEVSETGR
jgi:hypothetical protein